MPPFTAPETNAAGAPEASLSEREMVALRAACGPVGVLSFPPADVIRTLRQRGYVTIVLGGVAITPSGLERLLQERRRQQTARPTS